MKRNELRKSLQKIKKGLSMTSKEAVFDEELFDKESDKPFCSCKDAKGEVKMLYSTQKEAEDTVAYHHRETIRIYPCPTEKGWHLTKG